MASLRAGLDQNRIRKLEAGFRKAADDSVRYNSMDPLTGWISDSFSCERIYVFYRNSENGYDNVLEKCAPGVPSVQPSLQNLSREICAPYYARYRDGRILTMYDIEEEKDADRELYEILKPQGLRSLISFQLTLHGQDLGFLGIDNPLRSDMDYILYFAQSLQNIFSIHAAFFAGEEFKRSVAVPFGGQAGEFGSWNEMYEYAEKLDRNKSIGIIFSNLYGLEKVNMERGREYGDSLILETGRIFLDSFGSDGIFRTNGDNYIVLCGGASRQWFEERRDRVCSAFLDAGIQIEIGSSWSADWTENFERMLRKAAASARLLEAGGSPEAEKEESLITLHRGSRFLQLANTWLRMLEDSRVAFIAIDYNYFSLYNSVYGWTAGNEMLSRLSDVVGHIAQSSGGIAGYMGGDNFCLLLPGSGLTEEKIRSLVCRRTEYDIRYAGFAPSYGIYLAQYHNESAAQLYDYALTALSRVKGSCMGEERVAMADEESIRTGYERRLMLMDVKEAISRGEFDFWLQPMVDTASGRIICAEAVIRWHRGDRILLPAVFMEALEKSGYIFALERGIIDSVCRWLKHLKEEGLTQIPVDVGINGSDFCFGDMAEYFRLTAEKYGVEPRLIRARIAEEDFAQGGRILDFAARMKDFGFGVILSHFGMGMTTMQAVESMRISMLKLDWRLTQNITRDEGARQKVGSLISMAGALGIRTAVIRVRSREETEIVRKMGCGYIQGEFCYPAVPVEEFEKILADSDRMDLSSRLDGPEDFGMVSFDDLLRERLISSYVLEEAIGPACIFEKNRDGIRLLQMNSSCCRVLGIDPYDREAYDRLEDRLDSGYEEIIRSMRRTDSDPTDNYLTTACAMPDGSKKNIYATVIPITDSNGHSLYLVRARFENRRQEKEYMIP